MLLIQLTPLSFSPIRRSGGDPGAGLPVELGARLTGHFDEASQADEARDLPQAESVRELNLMNITEPTSIRESGGGTVDTRCQ